MDAVMRPIASEQNALRSPLNQLLGTEAHVRLLRVLANEVVGPITTAEAAARAGLTSAGARRALDRLSKTGFVQRVGGGRSQQFALREADPLSAQLAELFRRERDRYEALLSSLRAVMESFGDVRVAWINTPPVHVGEPLDINVLCDAQAVSWIADEFRRQVADIEASFGLTIEVHIFTRADSPDVVWDEVTLLSGVPEGVAPAHGAGPITHVEREERALRLSQAIVRLLDRNPSLTRRALRHIRRLLSEEQGAAAHDLREWQAILSQYSYERLQAFVVSTTSRANRLRQSSPFFAVLTPDERDEVLQVLESPR